MAFSDIVANDFNISGANDQFKETAVYATDGAASRVVQIVVTKQDTRENQERNQATTRVILETNCSTDAVNGIPSPKHNDSLTYGNYIWRFERIVDQQDNHVVIEWGRNSSLRTRGNG